MRRSWAIAVATCLVLGGVPASAQVTGASDRTVASCPEGTDPNRYGPTASTQPMGWFLGAVSDDAAGRIVSFVSYDEQIETWAFDVCTNTWTHPETRGERPAGHGQVVLMGDRGLVVAQVEGATDAGINTFEVWTHDLVSDRWARQGPIPWVAGVGQPIYEAASGLIMALDPPPGNQTAATELWRYDLDRDAWDAVVMSGDDPGSTADPLVVYDTSVGRIVAYDPDGGRTWLIDPEAGAWFEGQPGPTHRGGWSEGWARPLAALDETTGQVIVLTIEGVFAYVPASDTWETLLEAPADDAVEPVGPWHGINRAMVYDPVNERMVVVGGGETWGAPGWQVGGGVWAFDTRTREWIELLTSREPPLAIADSAAWGGEPDAPVEYAPVPSIDPALAPDTDGFVFEEVAPGLRRLVTDGAGHFPSATYIREARDMDSLAVTEDGKVMVWSTTHGIDNQLAGDRQRWILGEEGVEDAGRDMYAPLQDTSRLVTPDGSSWSSSRGGGGLTRTADGAARRFLADEVVNSIAITPDGRVWVAVEHRDGAGAIYVIEPDAQGEPVESPATPATETMPTGASGSSLIAVSEVILAGEPFFVRASDTDDIRRCSGFRAEADSVADGRFLSESQCWDEGAVWWEDPAAFESSEMSATEDRWVELQLGGWYRLDEAIVQADNNDAYLLSYRDPETGSWLPLWTVPPAYSFGMATRPVPGDTSARQALPIIVTTDAVRIEAEFGDGMYSVSEVQLFGEPVGD